MSNESSHPASHDPEIIRGLPPAATLVYLTLGHADAPLRADELEEQTFLPRRTVHRALSQLREESLVTADHDLPDAPSRKRYRLADT